MDGSIKTPIGTISKKTALWAGVGTGVLALLVWYRKRQNTSAAADTTGEINPATGYVYGSAEDASALEAQANYQYPSGSAGGGGGSSITTGFTSNSQWAQAVVQYMTDNSTVTDPSQLQEALGKYLTGAAVTDTQKNLIEQAIAVQGYPPVAGTTGYPPAINQNPTSSTPGETTSKPGTVSGLHVTNAATGEIDLAWTAVQGATRYEVYRIGTAGAAKGQGSERVVSYDTSVKIYPLASKSTYRFDVYALNAAGSSAAVSVSATTK
jgi:hypothetical protein